MIKELLNVETGKIGDAALQSYQKRRWLIPVVKAIGTKRYPRGADRETPTRSCDWSGDAQKALDAPRNYATPPKILANFLTIPLQRCQTSQPTSNQHPENPPKHRQNGERPWRDCRPVWILFRNSRNWSELTNIFVQLRPPQVQRHQPHHQGQGPRLCPALHRQG